MNAGWPKLIVAGHDFTLKTCHGNENAHVTNA